MFTDEMTPERHLYDDLHSTVRQLVESDENPMAALQTELLILSTYELDVEPTFLNSRVS